MGTAHQKAASTIASFTYTYDKTMHRLTKAEQGKDHTYTYDGVYRLTHSVPTLLAPNSNDMRAEDFTFDLLATNHRATGPDSIETYTYGQDNRLTSLALATPLVTAKNYTYTYDYENRLTGVVKVVNGITTVTFKYDPFGRRIEKRVNATVLGVNVLKVYIYVYDKEDVIIERLSTTIGGGAPGVTVTKYAHGPSLDEPLAIAKGGTIYFYHADGLGSIVALTSWSGATVEGYTYNTFGKRQRYGNAVKNTYGFTGREYDKETGLYYYRARYYDPETGRFISKDPIGFAGGDTNLYNYVLGDPVNLGDPTGEVIFVPLLAYAGAQVAAVAIAYVSFKIAQHVVNAVDAHPATCKTNLSNKTVNDTFKRVLVMQGLASAPGALGLAVPEAPLIASTLMANPAMVNFTSDLIQGAVTPGPPPATRAGYAGGLINYISGLINYFSE